jgi:hypothetical protein
MLTRSASTADHTTSGSSEPSRSTIRAPVKNHMNDVHCAAACMSGAMAKNVMPPSPMRSGSSAGDVTSPCSRIGSPPPRHAKNASSWRHTTPFGMPVVPPVYMMYRSSPPRSSRSGRRGDADAIAAS